VKLLDQKIEHVPISENCEFMQGLKKFQCRRYMCCVVKEREHGDSLVVALLCVWFVFCRLQLFW
jgi:hypothetical protein